MNLVYKACIENKQQAVYCIGFVIDRGDLRDLHIQFE